MNEEDIRRRFPLLHARLSYLVAVMENINVELTKNKMACDKLFDREAVNRLNNVPFYCSTSKPPCYGKGYCPKDIACNN